MSFRHEGPIDMRMDQDSGETAQGRLDSLDPDNFKYTMTAKEVSA